MNCKILSRKIPLSVLLCSIIIISAVFTNIISINASSDKDLDAAVDTALDYAHEKLDGKYIIDDNRSFGNKDGNYYNVYIFPESENWSYIINVEKGTNEIISSLGDTDDEQKAMTAAVNAAYEEYSEYEIIDNSVYIFEENDNCYMIMLYIDGAMFVPVYIVQKDINKVLLSAGCQDCWVGMLDDTYMSQVTLEKAETKTRTETPTLKLKNEFIAAAGKSSAYIINKYGTPSDFISWEKDLFGVICYSYGLTFMTAHDKDQIKYIDATAEQLIDGFDNGLYSPEDITAALSIDGNYDFSCGVNYGDYPITYDNIAINFQYGAMFIECNNNTITKNSSMRVIFDDTCLERLQFWLKYIPSNNSNYITAYTQIINEYINAYEEISKINNSTESGDSQLDQIGAINSHVNPEYLLNAHIPTALRDGTETPKPSYLLQDLDNDDVPELFIAYLYDNTDTARYLIYGMFTFQNGQAVDVSPGIGYRVRLYILNTNEIYEESSGGVAYSNFTTYTFSNGDLIQNDDIKYEEGYWYHNNQSITAENAQTLRSEKENQLLYADWKDIYEFKSLTKTDVYSNITVDMIKALIFMQWGLMTIGF